MFCFVLCSVFVCYCMMCVVSVLRLVVLLGVSVGG